MNSLCGNSPAEADGADSKCRVLLVDDNAVFLDALDQFCSTIPGVVVVGRATSGAEALEQSDSIHPDLVLTDFAMPWMHGVQVAQCLAARPQPPRVILMTADDDVSRAVIDLHGIDECLAKPGLMTSLEPALKRLFPRTVAESVGSK